MGWGVLQFGGWWRKVAGLRAADLVASRYGWAPLFGVGQVLKEDDFSGGVKPLECDGRSRAQPFMRAAVLLALLTVEAPVTACTKICK